MQTRTFEYSLYFVGVFESNKRDFIRSELSTANDRQSDIDQQHTTKIDYQIESEWHDCQSFATKNYPKKILFFFSFWMSLVWKWSLMGTLYSMFYPLFTYVCLYVSLCVCANHLPHKNILIVTHRVQIIIWLW